MRSITILLACFTLSQLAFAGPPKFEPERLFDIPKIATLIEAEVQKDLPRSQKNLFVFDVHGIFTQELVPSADGNVTLNNRFIPLLKSIEKNDVRIMAVSGHDKPEILYRELYSLRYGKEKSEELLADFTKDQHGDPESGFMLLPLRNGDFKLIRFNRFGNVVSAGVPNARFNTEKTAAVLFHLLSPEAVKTLSMSPALYDKLEAGMRGMADKIAGAIAVSANKYYPVKCNAFGMVEPLAKSLIEFVHSESNSDFVLNKLNNLIERKLCGVMKAGLLAYPHGKPSKDQKQAVKDAFRQDIEKMFGERKKIQDHFNPEDLHRAREELVHASAGLQLFYLEDAIGNLEVFQQDVIASGYFDDATIVLLHARLPAQDKQLSNEELEHKIGGATPEKKRSIEGLKNSTDKK